jgi:hypothetical protein
MLPSRLKNILLICVVIAYSYFNITALKPLIINEELVGAILNTPTGYLSLIIGLFLNTAIIIYGLVEIAKK